MIIYRRDAEFSQRDAEKKKKAQRFSASSFSLCVSAVKSIINLINSNLG
jgi:hypothetical protein